MGVYNNNKDGTRSTLANTIQVVDAPMEQFVSRGEFSAVTPNDVSADNKLVAENEVTKTYDTMPTASASLVGTIVQYVGTTTANYTNGYFYKCVSDGAITPTYSWEEVISGGGGSTVTVTQTLSSGTKIAEINVDGTTTNLFAPNSGIPHYTIMPSDSELLAMPNKTVFETDGYWTQIDGHGGKYIITTNAWLVGGMLKITDGTTTKYLAALDNDGNALTTCVDPTRYGVRAIAGLNGNLTLANTYATENSDIISRLTNTHMNATIKFPKGYYVFESPLNFTNRQYSVAGVELPVTRTATLSLADYEVGTVLCFPFLTNGQSAIQTSGNSNIENLAIYGNKNTYHFVIDRTKLTTAPNEVITETIAENEGTQIQCKAINKAGGGQINNVFIFNFYTGITCQGNTFIKNFYARHVHYGINCANDTKMEGIGGFNVHTLIRITGSLCSVLHERVDSCVHALEIVNGSSHTITDIDGDWCTDSLIAIGDGTTYGNIRGAIFNGIHGRCNTLKSYDSTQQTEPVDVRELADTDGYGVIRVYPRANFTDSRIVANMHGGGNPMDDTSNYLMPDILFTFASNDITGLENLTFVLAKGLYDIDEILRIVQTRTGFTARFDDASGVYFIEGDTVTTYGENEVDLPWVTPQDYGAKGDGVTDDTAAFTAAFAASPNVKCDGSKTYKFTGVVINNNTGSDLDLCGATLLNFHIKVRIAVDGYKSSDPNSSNFFKMHDGHLGKFTELPSDWQIPAIQCGTQMWLENLAFINTPYIAALTNNYRDRMVFKNLLMSNEGSLWTGITWTLDAINLITGNGTFARINAYDINHVATDTNSFAGDGWVMDNIDEFKSSNQSDYFFIHTRNQHTLNINRCVQTRIAIGTNTHVEFSNCHFENVNAMPVIETLTDSSTSAVSAIYQVDFDNCWFTDEYTLEVDKPNISYTNCYFRVCGNAVYPTTPFATVMGNRDFYNVDCKIIDCVFDIENNIINSEIWKKYKEQPKLTCNSYSGTTNEGTLADSIDATKTIASGQYKYPITGTYSYVGYTFNNSTCNDDINNNRIAHEKYEWTRTVNSVNSDMDGSRGIINIIGGWAFEIYRTLPNNTIQRARFYDSPIEEGKQNVTQKKFHIRECGNYLIINKTVSYGSTYTEVGYRLPWTIVTSIPNYTVNAQVYEKNGVLVTLDGSVIPNLDNKAYAQVTGEYTKPIIQASSLPTASASIVGKTYMYMGATNASTQKIHGAIYECVSDGAATPTYSWIAISVPMAGWKAIVSQCNDFADFKALIENF